jgi:prepilin-type processing-associated H-X9-DG protein
MNSSHMGRGTPAGGNVLFMDGHVEWRKFVNMQDPAPLMWQVKTFWF